MLDTPWKVNQWKKYNAPLKEKSDGPQLVNEYIFHPVARKSRKQVKVKDGSGSTSPLPSNNDHRSKKSKQRQKKFRDVWIKIIE